ncbi:hypothetical protein [Thiothrix subterranea]|uniref:Uncharacterized protein n=1 Tax=Thiothrix subterranea TaxID=2735563 RepID=A0AA51MPQ4_9GAMM|nr:hypothetical protein [Thiothrix subterranea]MDQ5768267.1 hypothetical protein [Thiothrix subterranea]WML87795.1 hypothetical protein RCG00_05365 [Thiothrix subterranea]
MKYFFPALMVFVILAGVSLTLTPYIAEQFFPASKTTLRVADPERAKQALADWFGTTPANVTDVQASNQSAAQGSTSWFMFGTERTGVEYFIRQNNLKQQNLSPEILQNTFMTQQPPAPWWQPAALERETCFIGSAEGREIGLIYHAELKKGFLIVRTHQKPAKF